MSKLKLLAILPYEGLQTLVQDAVRQREDIEVDCYVGDMDKGVQLALAHEKEGYFAIVSRAGTAELISRASALPVICLLYTSRLILAAQSSNLSCHLPVSLPLILHRKDFRPFRFKRCVVIFF